MAIDWGDIIGGALGGIADDLIGGTSGNTGPFPMPAPGAPLPPVVELDTRTGQIKKCKRRRRRRLLTPTDLSDLAALATIVGKGDALKFAVTKAVRR